MGIKCFEDIEAWKLARELAGKVYAVTRKEKFSKDYALKDQIQRAASSVMHNIAEGFDAETTPEFIRFLRYSKRSCSEVQSELYLGLDQNYIDKAEFQDIYNHTSRTRAAIFCFINYLKQYQENKK